jgi:hypothetical protein
MDLYQGVRRICGQFMTVIASGLANGSQQPTANGILIVDHDSIRVHFLPTAEQDNRHQQIPTAGRGPVVLSQPETLPFH